MARSGPPRSGFSTRTGSLRTTTGRRTLAPPTQGSQQTDPESPPSGYPVTLAVTEPLRNRRNHSGRLRLRGYSLIGSVTA